MNSVEKRVDFLENRIKALYHNCHSQASFLKADAHEMEGEAECMLHEAKAYECVAGWLRALVKDAL